MAINLHTWWQTVQIQISWLLQKPTDLDLHCLQRQDMSGFSRTRVKKHVKCRYKICTGKEQVFIGCHHIDLFIYQFGLWMKFYSLSHVMRKKVKHTYRSRWGIFFCNRKVSVLCLFFSWKIMLWVLTEALLICTHNICFQGEISRILHGYPSYLEHNIDFRRWLPPHYFKMYLLILFYVFKTHYFF